MTQQRTNGVNTNGVTAKVLYFDRRYIWDFDRRYIWVLPSKFCTIPSKSVKIRQLCVQFVAFLVLFPEPLYLWLRTNGVNTNGVTAKILFFDGFGEGTKNVTTGTQS